MAAQLRSFILLHPLKAVLLDLKGLMCLIALGIKRQIRGVRVRETVARRRTCWTEDVRQLMRQSSLKGPAFTLTDPLLKRQRAMAFKPLIPQKSQPDCGAFVVVLKGLTEPDKFIDSATSTGHLFTWRSIFYDSSEYSGIFTGPRSYIFHSRR